MNEPCEHSPGQGVYFRLADYVGLIPRIAIVAVDSLALFAIYIAIAIIVLTMTSLSEGQLFLVFAVVAWLYLTVLKASTIRTIGYRLLGARIVNLAGEKPSVFRMTFRLLICCFGPFPFLLDLLWAGTDEQKQTLRDRFAGTCVVKWSAKPAGHARIRFSFWYAIGFNLMYPQVLAPGASVAGTSATPPVQP